MEGQRVKRRYQGNVIVSICTPSPHKSCISTQEFDNDGIHISTGDCDECKCSVEVEKMKVDFAERFNILDEKLENILSVINIKSGIHGDAVNKGYSDDVASANDAEPLSEQNGIPYDGDVELTHETGPRVIKKQKRCSLGEIKLSQHGTQNDDKGKTICSTQDNTARKPVNEHKEDDVAENTVFGCGLRNDSEENFGDHDDDLNSVEKRVGGIIDDLHKRIVTLDKKGEGHSVFLTGTSESSVGWTDIKAFNSMKAEMMIADKDGARGGGSMDDGLDSLFNYSRCTPNLSKLDELPPKKLKKVKKALFQHMEHCERVDGLMDRNGEKSMKNDEVSGGRKTTSLQILDAMTGKWVPVTNGAKVEGSPASLTIRPKNFPSEVNVQF
ncbi:hypothetical protein CCACVL1_11124 [Corchorus capsularis]|uniref:Uncharacterized protein n=1 Tax=Corchorus capsularis TaxID=210143 RepID=A0A1R3IMS4_COCAP|nr:hypothetical protein CCACVL1_11124 [Corchorus capsularis]